MKQKIEAVLFGSKWLLIPFFFGLIVTQAIYCYVNLHEVWHLMMHFDKFTEAEVMLVVVGLVDMTMIACLIYMVISGSYNSFISKDHHEETARISSGLLKIKMSTSIVGVSSIHMLQAFIGASGTSWETIQKQLAIHVGFIIGALALAWIDNLHETHLMHEAEAEKKMGEPVKEAH